MSNIRMIISLLLVLQLAAPLTAAAALKGAMSGYWEGEYTMSSVSSIEGQAFCGGTESGIIKTCITDTIAFSGDLTLVPKSGTLTINNAPFDCMNTFGPSYAPSQRSIGYISGSLTYPSGVPTLDIISFGDYADFPASINDRVTSMPGTFGGTFTSDGLIVLQTSAGSQTIVGTVSTVVTGSYTLNKINDDDCWGIPQPGCTSDSDCQTGEKCSADGDCVFELECSTDSGCPSGQRCSAAGECVEAECREESDCTSPQVCFLGICTNPPGVCSSNAGCPSGEICVGSQCVKKLTSECDDDNPCPEGTQCFGFSCVKNTPPIRIWTETTKYGPANIQITNNLIIIVNGRTLQPIDRAKFDIVITANGVTINGRPLGAMDGVLVIDVSELPQEGDKISTTLGDDLVLFVDENTVLVFDRCLVDTACSNTYLCKENSTGCVERSCCNNLCVNLTLDRSNCGKCGIRCTSEQLCFDGTCKSPLDVVNMTNATTNGDNEPGFFAGFADFFSGLFKWLAGLFGGKN